MAIIPTKVFWFVALACEAKPIINRFSLKKSTSSPIFELYQSGEYTLTITGVGKAAMAAGVAYTMALHGSAQPMLLVNVGIAGHQHAPLGELLIAGKITDADNAKCYFPQTRISRFTQTASLLTVSRPHSAYAEDTLYDMEASAFYEIATRFSSSELILVAKIISDNQHKQLTAINASQVAAWIEQRLDTLCQLIQQLAHPAQMITFPSVYRMSEITSRIHFTVTEQNQLSKLLLRWQVLSDESSVPISLSEIKSAKQYLLLLKKLVDALPVTV